MHAYEISAFAGAEPKYVGDLAAVRKACRLIAIDGRKDVLVTLVDVQTGKAATIDLLNGRRPSRVRIRNWTLTRRGALVEIPLEPEDDEEPASATAAT